MPLIKSKSPAAIGHNIKTEMASGGKKKAQAVAIALNVARKAGANVPPPKRRPKRSLGDMMDGD